MFTFEQQEQAFAAATEKQKELYTSYEAGIALAQIVKKHGLTTKHVDFAAAVGDVILGLVPQEKLPELLVERLQVTQSEAFRITADLLDFLAPLNEEPKPTKDTSLESAVSESLAQVTPTDQTKPPAPTDDTPAVKTDNTAAKNSPPDDAASLASDIAATEAALKSIPPIRTMAQDAQDTHDGTTHSTSQADLLNTKNRWSNTD